MKFIEGGITAPVGIKAAGICCGIKQSNLDLALIYSEKTAQIAAVFTANEVQAAPIKLCRERLCSGLIQAVIINSGNANACTGQQGLLDSRTMADITAAELQIDSSLVWAASTGIIGERLPISKIKSGIKKIVPALSKAMGKQAARAILTTDTCTKEAAVELEIADKTITIGAMAKGSGMICPNMATMLCFVTTDAHIKAEHLQLALNQAVNQSFNRISVDGDTSTNDMVMILANNAAGGAQITPESAYWQDFCDALNMMCIKLAKDIIKDGEGATKFIEIKVIDAISEKQAQKIASCVGNSALVKTALFGQQANWGRILAAAGMAGAGIIPEQIDLYLNSVKLVENGCGLGEQVAIEAEERLKSKDIEIIVDLKQGDKSYNMWSCDLSYEYVRINADYHT